MPPPFISSHSLFSPLPLGSASTTPLKLLLLRRLRTIHDIKRNGQPSVSSYSITLKIFSLSFASVTQPLSGFLLYLWVLSFLLGFTFLYFVKKPKALFSSHSVLFPFKHYLHANNGQAFKSHLEFCSVLQSCIALVYSISLHGYLTYI